MASSFGNVLFLVMMRCLLVEAVEQCQKSNGSFGCECNIMGACDANGNPKPGLDHYNLTGYAPSGLQQFGRFVRRDKQNLAYLCEDGVVAILYDCENRVPLYAATVMNGNQLNAGYKRPRSDQFRLSENLEENYQPNGNDYKDSSKHKICYTQNLEGAASLIDCEWYKALNSGEAIPPLTQCSHNDKLISRIHTGHLIASAYGRGDIDRMIATFTYTNSIPQFGAVNSGSWRVLEQALVMQWGKEICSKRNGKDNKNDRIHIIVGAIPSTYKPGEQRYFGHKGFANYQSEVFRIKFNVPRVTWTAACCTFQFKDSSGNDQQGTRHTFFALKNAPRALRDELPQHSDGFFKMYLSSSAVQKIVLFPNNGGCKEDKNYVPL